MATNTDIIKIASSLIPQYDGNGEKLNNIISALNALKSIVTAATAPVAIQIILSKLEKKARSAVGDAPADIEEIINKLNQKCKQSISSDVVLAKLSATRQNGALNKFTSDIEELTNQLELAYIGDNIPLDTATKMATKAGIKALANGVKSLNTQMILKAGTFSTLNEAIGKATENDQEDTHAMKVLHYGRGSRGGRNSFNQNQQYRPSYQSTYRPNQEWRNNAPRRGGYNSNRRGSYNPDRRRENNNPNWRNDRSHNNGNQERYNNNTTHTRNSSGRGRTYQVTTEENNPEDRHDGRDNNRNDFLERADRSERSSQ